MKNIQNYVDLVKSFIVVDLSAILTIFGYAIVNHKSIDEYQVITGSVSFLTLLFLFVLLVLWFGSLDRKLGD